MKTNFKNVYPHCVILIVKVAAVILILSRCAKLAGFYYISFEIYSHYLVLFVRIITASYYFSSTVKILLTATKACFTYINVHYSFSSRKHSIMKNNEVCQGK
jgi:hypothetical protein